MKKKKKQSKSSIKKAVQPLFNIDKLYKAFYADGGCKSSKRDIDYGHIHRDVKQRVSYDTKLDYFDY